ncbi:Formyl-coenzyme A transferase [Pelotomaculum schinkii]|uniref:Formyl-coenzyme A transferase n=1 Tax=Pelotomaculum schinkii TaxID=78350 RepID=A0A4Y7R744_9FIRM|nr:CaiB/BaiF CoA-transferase family protein [Pelotomaculum schinkii]TEB04440.1 Formyl-coenzyme A transferase [Pelotomaculum schinkii]
MELPLKGVKVLDISRVLTGPFCTMQLSDLGAEVIKIEIPGEGDETRSWGPPYLEGESAYYLSINRNKKSVTVNMKSEEGHKILMDLAAKSDVVIENFLPGTTKRLGLDYDTIRSVNPEIIYCSISGFGQAGPYRTFPAYDLLLQGLGGLMSITGEKDGDPVRIGVALIDIGAGMYAAMGIISALMTKKETGKGQYIDVSLLGTEVAWLTYMAANYLASGKDPIRMGSAHPSIVPYQAFKAKDKYFILAVGNDNIWKRFCKALDLNIVDDPRYATNEMRVKHREELNQFLKDMFKEKNASEWLEKLQGERVPCGMINSIGEVVNHPQVVDRQMIVELPHPKIGKVRVPGCPINFSLTPVSYNSAPPLLGQHTEEVLGTLGYSKNDIENLRAKGVI